MFVILKRVSSDSDRYEPVVGDDSLGAPLLYFTSSDVMQEVINKYGKNNCIVCEIVTDHWQTRVEKVRDRRCLKLLILQRFNILTTGALKANSLNCKMLACKYDGRKLVIMMFCSGQPLSV